MLFFFKHVVWVTVNRYIQSGNQWKDSRVYVNTDVRTHTHRVNVIRGPTIYKHYTHILTEPFFVTPPNNSRLLNFRY